MNFMDGYVLAMLFSAVLSVLLVAIFFFNDAVSQFLLFRPAWIFSIGILISIFGIFFSLIGGDVLETLDAITKASSPDKQELYKKIAYGYLAQVKIYDYILIPIGAGFMVSAIFMRFTLLMRLKDDQYKHDSEEIYKMKSDLSHKYRDINYYLDNGQRGLKIIDMNKSIESMENKLWKREDYFENKFGFLDFKYYKRVDRP